MLNSVFLNFKRASFEQTIVVPYTKCHVLVLIFVAALCLRTDGNDNEDDAM